MADLDVKTILVMLAVTVGLCAVALWVTYRENRRMGGLSFFPCSCCAIAAGSLLLAYQSHLPALLSIAVGDTLVGLSIAVALEGIRRLYGRAPRPHWIPVTTVLLLAGFTWFTAIRPSLTGRIMLISAVLASLSMVAAKIAFDQRRRESYSPTLFIALSFGIMALLNTARLVLGNSIDHLLSGDLFTVLVTAGTMLCYLCWSAGVIVTVSQRHLNRARKALHEARAAGQAKSRFLAVMSHEIRTPMNGVLGLTEVLLGSGLNPEQKRFASIIQSSGQSLMKILDDVLDLSKLEAGRFQVEQMETSVEQLVTSASDLVAAAVATKGLSFELHLSPELPEKISCDPLRIGQVLVNLLNNAIKFTESGSIQLRVVPAQDLPTETAIRFEVIDTGIGIPAQQHDAVFESFAQADASTTRKYGGSGLGLAISRHLVELLGGKIDFDSEKAAGSTFWFEVPIPPSRIATADSPPEPQSTSSPPGSGTTTANSARADSKPSLPAARILIADDDPASQIVVTAMLRKMGHTVDKVQDGEAAVAAVKARAYDLVLMDYHMPRMDGIRATEILRDDPAAAALPIIALTAGVLETEQRRCLEAGMNAVITKPITADKLSEGLEKWLVA